MFGCTKLLRNWNGDASRQGSVPTHVDMYETARIKAESSIDRDGIILAALMSGADYMPEGVTGFGIKIACEAARAGFGRDLLAIPKEDKLGLREWRERLEHELQSNASGYFRTRHKTLKVPESFPGREVLYYYQHPVVSGPEQIEKYRREIQWTPRIDIQGLRAFVAEAFEWRYQAGAIHFIRGLAPISLALRLAFREGALASEADAAPPQPADLVKGISKQRTHASTGLTSELRVSYFPCEAVPLDLNSESEKGPSHTAAYHSEVDDDDPGLELGDDGEREQPENSPLKKKSSATTFDPTKAHKEWVWEVLVKRSMPRTFAEWEISQQKLKEPKMRKARGAAGKASSTTQARPGVGVDRFFKITKAATYRSVHETESPEMAQTKDQSEASIPIFQPRTPERRRIKERQRLKESPRKGVEVNPWSLSQKASEPVSKAISSLGVQEQKTRSGFAEDDPFIIPSSPASADPNLALAKQNSKPTLPATTKSRRAELGSDLEQDVSWVEAFASEGKASETRKEALEGGDAALRSGAEAAKKGSKVNQTGSKTSQRRREPSKPRARVGKTDADSIESPRFDFGDRTPIQQPLIPSSSPSLPSPTLIFASNAPSESHPLKSSLRKTKAPSPRARRRSDARPVASGDSGDELTRCNAAVAKLCTQVEVLDLTSD